jgi:hypothetical protein
MSVSRVEVEAAVASAPSRAKRTEYIGALLARATGDEVIIVGGSAIEVWTSARTVSQDIDLVTSPREAARRVIESWGFVRSGRAWRREDWNLDIDLVGPVLSGSRSHVRTTQTPYGPVGVIGVEDLIASRLIELKHWPPSRADPWRKGLIEQIDILLSDYGDQLDDAYLDDRARRDKFEDILNDFRTRLGIRMSADLDRSVRRE